MVRRRAVVVLLGVFTASVALLFPMLASTGQGEKPSIGRLNMERPAQVNENDWQITELHVTLAVPEAEFTYWTKRNEQFMEQHRDMIVVLHNELPAEAERWSEQAQLGLTSDIYLMDSGQVIDLAVHGFLRQMDDYYTGDRINEQLKALTEALKWNNSMWGVPVDADPVVLLWHRGLLQQAGLTQPPAAWPSFLEASDRLLAIDPSIIPFELDVQDGRAVSTWLGAFAEQEEIKGLPPLGSQSIQLLRYLAQGEGERMRHTSAVEELAEQFRQNKLLAASMPWSVFIQLPEATRSQLRYDTDPARLVWTGGRSFVVSAQSKKQEAALQWIRAMTEPSEALSRYTALGRIPALASLYRTQYDQGDITLRPPFALQVLMEKAVHDVSPDWWARWQKWNAVWQSAASRTFTLTEAERLIQLWNGFAKAS